MISICIRVHIPLSVLEVRCYTRAIIKFKKFAEVEYVCRSPRRQSFSLGANKLSKHDCNGRGFHLQTTNRLPKANIG